MNLNNLNEGLAPCMCELLDSSNFEFNFFFFPTKVCVDRLMEGKPVMYEDTKTKNQCRKCELIGCCGMNMFLPE